jgi:nucleoside-diphosphate-sugar epimerase
VRGLWLSAERCEAGEVYNVGADLHYSILEIIQAIRTQVKANFNIQQDPELMRRCDELVVSGDITKFRRCSGWRTEIELTRTLRDMLNWWRSRLAPVPSSRAWT